MNHTIWLLWRDGTHSPAFNMAVDELLLEQMPQINSPVLRTYRWDRPSLSIGSSQRFPSDQEIRYTIVRRPTGGGNVWHDIDLTYTIVLPPDHPIAELDRMASYKIFHEAMLPMLADLGAHALLKSDETPGVDRATMKCFTSPSRFDLLAECGKKYAGAAQRRTRNGILHQGSILLEAAHGDWDLLESALRQSLADFFHIEYQPVSIPADFEEKAGRLARQKYETREWNHGCQS